MEKTSSNKTIAKNAVALYFRMIITMLISIYTSRIILNALGVTDYGIYNVVGGFVSLFSLISISLQGAIGRFLQFELGRKNEDILNKVFSLSIWVLSGLSLIVLIATETVGLWYYYNHLVIPNDRLSAGLWCFHLSVITFIINLINAPYSSAIIAHERMDIYAYLSIIDAFLKLLICFVVLQSSLDKLVLYAFLLLCVNIINQCVYVWFCKKHYRECRVRIVFDKKLFYQLFSFAGWSFIGSSAAILRTQGASLLLNWAGGPVVNAANGISATITGVVSNFVSGFTQAFNPQITKRYASQEYQSLVNLLIYGSKYSFYLMLFLALPVFFNAQFILKVWLGVVPEHTVGFVRWTLVFLLAESISRPIITAKNATGRIRNYQIVVGGILLFMLPISYWGLKYGMPVEFVAAMNACTAIVAVFARLYMLRGDFPVWSSRLFCTEVVLNVILVSCASCILPYLSYSYFAEGWTNIIITTLLSFLSTVICIVFIGCSSLEREIFVNKLYICMKKMHLNRILHQLKQQ